jgi:hypothetical protein
MSDSPDEVAELAMYAHGDGCYLVADSEDERDWLVIFTDGAGFNAHEWAESMVRVYNDRVNTGLKIVPHV